jgi:hypothetical protein
MKIQVKQARELLNALITVTSGTHSVVTRSPGGQTVNQVPYELDDNARWNLTKNLGLAERIVKDADKAREGILREITGGVGRDLKRADEPEKFQQFLERSETIEDQVESAQFLRVRLSGLKISGANPIPGVVVSALQPILLDDVVPAPEDVIPD